MDPYLTHSQQVQAVRRLADSHFDATMDQEDQDETDREMIEQTVPRMKKALHLSDEDINQVLERRAELDEYDRIVDRTIAVAEEANLESSFEKELERDLYVVFEREARDIFHIPQIQRV